MLMYLQNQLQDVKVIGLAPTLTNPFKYLLKN